MSKFGNRKTEYNGRLYDSKKEANRAAELDLLLKIGEISDLRAQVPFELIPAQKGERACSYIADFVYRNKAGEIVVMDVKGMKTKDYIIKRKLMLFLKGIRIQQV